MIRLPWSPWIGVAGLAVFAVAYLVIKAAQGHAVIRQVREEYKPDPADSAFRDGVLEQAPDEYWGLP